MDEKLHDYCLQEMNTTPCHFFFEVNLAGGTYTIIPLLNLYKLKLHNFSLKTIENTIST